MAQIEITDSHGKYTFAQPPKRVIVLNWALAEQMLELGITPIGMADIEGYAEHATSPILPSEIVDVGDRLSPKLSIIKALNPELIIIGYSQRSLQRPLSNIATVVYFNNFSKRNNNFERSADRFTELAKLFDQTELATQKLAALNAKLTELKTSLKEKFREQDAALPDVEIIVPSSEFDQQYWLFGKNSMPFYAAAALGLNVVSAPETNKYGVSKYSHDDLIELSANFSNINNKSHSDHTCRLILSSYSRGSIDQSDDQPHCLAELEYQNAFGGVMSVLYLAQSIHDALIKTL